MMKHAQFIALWFMMLAGANFENGLVPSLFSLGWLAVVVWEHFGKEGE